MCVCICILHIIYPYSYIYGHLVWFWFCTQLSHFWLFIWSIWNPVENITSLLEETWKGIYSVLNNKKWFTFNLRVHVLSHSVVPNSLQLHGLQPTRLLCLWDSPGKNIGVGISSVAQSCRTLCDPMNCSTPGLPVRHQLLEFTQTHVHRVGDAIQPSHLSSSSLPAPNPSQHQSLFQWVNFFAWGGQSTGVSALASFLPKYTQDRFPLE